MAKITTLDDLVMILPAGVDRAKFVDDLLRAVTRLRRRPLDVYYAGPRSLRIDGVTMMVDLQPTRAVIVHFNGQTVHVQVPR